VAFGF